MYILDFTDYAISSIVMIFLPLNLLRVDLSIAILVPHSVFNILGVKSIKFECPIARNRGLAVVSSNYNSGLSSRCLIRLLHTTSALL